MISARNITKLVLMTVALVILCLFYSCTTAQPDVYIEGPDEKKGTMLWAGLLLEDGLVKPLSRSGDYFHVEIIGQHNRYFFKIHRCILEVDEVRNPFILEQFRRSIIYRIYWNPKEKPVEIVDELFFQKQYKWRKFMNKLMKEWAKKYKDKLVWDKKEEKFILGQ